MLALLWSVMRVRGSQSPDQTRLSKWNLFLESWHEGLWIRHLFIIWWRLKPFEAALKLSFVPWTVLFPMKSIRPIWRKSWNVFIKNLNFFSTEEGKRFDILDDMGVTKLSAKDFYKWTTPFKGMFHLTMIFFRHCLAYVTHRQVVLNLHPFLSSVVHRRRYFEECC